MDAPIGIKRINGYAAAIGPAATIEPALNGSTPVTIDLGTVAGETVYLSALRKVAPGTFVRVDPIAQDFEHPEHGRIIAAWIDMARLDGAPKLAEIERQRNARARAAYLTAEQNAAKSIPSCHNCGNCPQCC